MVGVWEQRRSGWTGWASVGREKERSRRSEAGGGGEEREGERQETLLLSNRAT